MTLPSCRYIFTHHSGSNRLSRHTPFCFVYITGLECLLNLKTKVDGNGVESSTPKKKGRASKKQPPPAHTDIGNTTAGEEKPSMKSVMALLTAMNTRMDRFERGKNGSNSASVHTVYTVPPEPTTSRSTAEEDPARHQESAVPDGYDDVSEEVWAHVASHIPSDPAIFIPMDDETASGEEGALPVSRKRGLKSGKVRTMDSIITRKVVWPHEVVFTTQGQPPVYSEMSLALFVNGYLTCIYIIC